MESRLAWCRQFRQIQPSVVFWNDIGGEGSSDDRSHVAVISGEFARVCSPSVIPVVAAFLSSLPEPPISVTYLDVDMVDVWYYHQPLRNDRR